MDLIQLKIQNDKNIIKYISLIRKFDNSLSINTVKHKIENSEFAIEFDLEYYNFLDKLNDTDRKVLFRKLILNLINLGASIEIYQNGEQISLEIFDNWLYTLKRIEHNIEIDIDRE